VIDTTTKTMLPEWGRT